MAIREVKRLNAELLNGGKKNNKNLQRSKRNKRERQIGQREDRENKIDFLFPKWASNLKQLLPCDKTMLIILFLGESVSCKSVISVYSLTMLCNRAFK